MSLAASRSKISLRWFREVWWFLGCYRWRFLGLSLIALVGSCTGLIPPWFLGLTVDAVAGHSTKAHLTLLALSMVGLLVVLHLVRVWSKQASGILQAEVCATVRERALDQLLLQGVRDGRLVGNELSRLETGIRDFTDLYRIVQNEILFSTMNLFACVILFLRVDPGLVVLMVLYVLCVLGLLRILVPRIAEVQAGISRAREAFSGLFTDVVGSALSVRAEGAEQLMASKVGLSARQLERLEAERARLIGLQWRCFNCINASFYGLVLYRLGLQGLAGVIPVSMIVVSFGYVREFIGATLRMFEITESFVQSVVGFTRMLHLLADRDQIFERTAVVSPGWRSIELADVTHRYSGMSADALQNVSLTLLRGTRTALAGPSGSGKSTCVKLLLGLVEPEHGRVMLDRRDLKEYALGSLRESMAIVLQECEILSLSLRENITMLRRIPEDRLEAILEICGLCALVEKLPQGLATVVGESGYRLSGGERQRVALARGIVRQPSFLVVDEATSMLDSEVERCFFEGLRRLLPDLTLLLISHHERTHQFVDSVVRLENGKVVVPPVG